MKSLAEQILELQLELANLKRTAGRLKKLEKQLEEERAGLSGLEKKVDKEYRDLTGLNQKSWVDMFLDREEERKRLDGKGKTGILQCRFQLKNAEKGFELMEFEIEILREKACRAFGKRSCYLQKLKYKQKYTVELSIKKESDKAIVLKNRLKVIFHKLTRLGAKDPGASGGNFK